MMHEETNGATDVAHWHLEPGFLNISWSLVAEFKRLPESQRQKFLKRWSRSENRGDDDFLILLSDLKADADWVIGAEAVAENERETARYDAIQAAKAAQVHITTIESKLGDTYRPAITAEVEAIEAGHADAETKAFLASMGIEADQSGAMQSPEVQTVIHARAAAKVYLSDAARADIARHPDLIAAAEGLASLRGRLGLASTVPPGRVTDLLWDQPRGVRARAAEITDAITKGVPQARIGRTGDSLFVYDAEHAISHEVELSDPPVLVKRRGVLEVRREFSHPPSDELLANREQQATALRQVLRHANSLGVEAAGFIESFPAGWEALPDLTTQDMADTLEKIQKASSDLPMAATTLRRHLAAFSEVLVTSRWTAEAWITDAEKLPYPDGLAEEAQRREHLERPLAHLAHMDAIAAMMSEEVRELERHHNETPTELGQAANGFDTVTDENLDLLQSLGFDRWDSMDDVHAFLVYAQRIAKKRLGLSFPPDLLSGRVALGERPFGREASVLVDELYKWLPGDRAEPDHLGRYQAIRADLALGPDSQIMGWYRAIKATTSDRLLPTVGLDHVPHVFSAKAVDQQRRKTEYQQHL